MKILFTSLIFVILSFHGFGQEVYITKTGEKYHKGTCQYVSKSKILKELKDVIDYYDACKVCKPPVAIVTDVKKSPEKKPTYVPAKKTAPTKSRSTSVQCSGRTQAGARCKRMTTNSNGRCYQH